MTKSIITYYLVESLLPYTHEMFLMTLVVIQAKSRHFHPYAPEGMLPLMKIPLQLLFLVYTVILNKCIYGCLNKCTWNEHKRHKSPSVAGLIFCGFSLVTRRMISRTRASLSSLSKAYISPHLRGPNLPRHLKTNKTLVKEVTNITISNTTALTAATALTHQWVNNTFQWHPETMIT